ncbi:ScbR family autoregulator-binding transcription factor [Streptomyces sp. P9(2023)]|uniref:ScbR family autoregulator-binding transcription factor n=1 Tax=Streptomyces sp. P9(2023) TaxID=3064394 RepID=UPI0028F412EE|nr:ScbR family autoregulator-binding transcription factor [Streptomyces sp. P9(2023)]MDT9691525.1 ScbR family autoregulator-binding transcription factor [Streptomyces sp. P9(2023)]
MTNDVRAARTRDALIRSAAVLFDQCGYAEASLSRISAGAGVSPGALHFHFTNKAAIARAVEARAARLLHRTARVTLREATDPLRALTDSSLAFARLMNRDVVVRAGFQLSCENAHGNLRDLRRQWWGYVQYLLNRAAERGMLAEAAVPERTAATVVAATVGLEILSRSNREWLSSTSLSGIWQVLLPCVAAPHILAMTVPAVRDRVPSTPAP